MPTFGCCGSAGSGTCGCSVIAGANVVVTGDGSGGSPFIISSTGGGGGTPSVVTAGTGISVTGSGAPATPYVVSTLPPATGSVAIATSNTGNVNFTGDGTTGNPLQASVDIPGALADPLACAAVQACVASGPAGSSAPILANDTATVDLAGDGTTASPLTANVIVSPTAGNTLVASPNGLLVPAGGVVSGTRVSPPPNVPHDDTNTFVSWDAVANADWAATAPSNAFSVPVAGYYQVNIAVSWPTNGNGIRELELEHGVGNVVARNTLPASATGPVTNTISTIVGPMAAGDILVTGARQTSGAPLPYLQSPDSYFTASFVRPL